MKHNAPPKDSRVDTNSDTDVLLKSAPLGKKSAYVNHYSPSLLFPLAREPKRTELNINPKADLPFFGFDRWIGYELSWLNSKGKPEVAICEIIVPCSSKFLIESKSQKLYLNSFNNTHFASIEEVESTLAQDISAATEARVSIKLWSLHHRPSPLVNIGEFQGDCLDSLDIECDSYTPKPEYLRTSDSAKIVSESIFSNLLKSNCLVTGQPDWGSISIDYTGLKIDHEGLLKYIVSFRDHNEFHEQCVERVFCDIVHRCQPDTLTVQAQYTRRGGLDINPYRTNQAIDQIPEFYRLVRQ